MDYPEANIVQLSVKYGNSQDLSALRPVYVRKNVDDDFRALLKDDDPLRETFSKIMEGKIDEEQVQNDKPVATHFKMICTALKNRAVFAATQKIGVESVQDSVGNLEAVAGRRRDLGLW